MTGKIEDLTELVNPRSRLGQGLALLRDCLAGLVPGVEGEIARLRPGETRRMTLDGDALYLLMQCYQSRQRGESRFEAHARHTDVQYVWSGRECIEVCPLGGVQPKPAFDAAGNAFFPIGEGVHSRLLLQAGEVAVLLPEDAHAPCLRADDSRGEWVRKVVVKIRDAHLSAAGPVSIMPGVAPVSAETSREALRT